MKKITILGSTGSIGTQALEVIDKCDIKFNVIGLSCGNNIELIKKQIEKYNPKYVSVKTKDQVDHLKSYFTKKNITYFYGDLGLIELASICENDIILVALSGKVALMPTVTAIKNKINVAIANKETLVMAGDYVMSLAKEYSVDILPVDSEHSAIHQCIRNINEVKRLILTASGGPFLDKTLSYIKNATLDETLNHPKWKMGKKITIDCATLMNKGLEVIEAHHLFNIDYKNIKVVIHPQSIVHSAIEYIDGSVVAQMGLPSMHIPIQYAICYPQRVLGVKTDSFDFTKVQNLNFLPPDYNKFPSLKLAFEAGEMGKTYPLCLNAANEVCVYSFLNQKIKLFDIYKITFEIINNHKPVSCASINDLLLIDDEIRKKTNELINNCRFK